jgi:hypothetical protein
MGPVRRAPSPADAYYDQRQAIAATSDRLRRLREAINDPVNLSSFQWAQWFAYVRDYHPDLVLELGRGNGNSTAAVNEALHQLGHGRLVSFCLTQTWREKTVPLLAPLVEADWFDRIEARVGNVLHEDFRQIIGDARRVLLIWDAHGFEIASLVLGHVLPTLADREHFVIMHDISDLRFRDKSEMSYGDDELWQGMERAYRGDGRGSRVCLGWVFTLVDQAISVVDFLTRNGGDLRSADESFHREIGQSPDRLAEIQRALSADDWSMMADWAYFSLNELPAPYTFPRFVRPTLAATVDGRDRRETPEIRATRTLDLIKIALRRLAAYCMRRW